MSEMPKPETRVEAATRLSRGDLDDLCRRIEEGGGTVLPATTATFEQGNRGVMTLDPDGTRIELIERPSA